MAYVEECLVDFTLVWWILLASVMMDVNLWDTKRLYSFSSEEFELTANSLGLHIETHGKLFFRTLNYLTVNP